MLFLLRRLKRRCARVKSARLLAFALVTPFLATAGFAASPASVDTVAPASTTTPWNAAAAAHYLDGRQTWWQGWKVSQRDHSTVCVSCHTVLPYALARSSLRGSLGEQDISAPEHVMLNNVLRRVTLWNEVGPFYHTGIDGPLKTPESRGTESVLNALVLAIYDAQKNHMTDIERSAFDDAWALQLKSGPQAGAWDWLNFHLAPWESSESQYYGAALAAIAVGKAPDDYRDDPKIQGNLRLLRGYLRREYATQPLINKVYLLWASGKLPGLLTSSERSALLTTILSKQQPDGGWSLTDLGTWQRKDKTALETRSDGYATGLTLLALEQSGLAQNLPQAKRGLAWLEQNQLQDEGKWPAWSVNLKRDPSSYIGHFMNDAATGFAVLAIENSH
jgi:squalene-hopene/tetraprenyl-beta-curcumene cyclase